MQKVSWIVGVDEAGRGPLAGPVSVAVFAMPTALYERRTEMLKGIRDSKKLTALSRERWFISLKKLEKEGKVRTGISLVSNTIIDSRGITFAIRTGVQRSLKKLNISPAHARILLDGSLYAPKDWIMQQTIIRGDDRIAIIAAASILAKVRRDRRMRRLSPQFPKYDFHEHKGYGSAAHIKALKRYGLSPLHRKSFCKFLLSKSI